jgi:hypothetical protein
MQTHQQHTCTAAQTALGPRCHPKQQQLGNQLPFEKQKGSKCSLGAEKQVWQETNHMSCVTLSFLTSANKRRKEEQGICFQQVPHSVGCGSQQTEG